MDLQNNMLSPLNALSEKGDIEKGAALVGHKGVKLGDYLNTLIKQYPTMTAAKADVHLVKGQKISVISERGLAVFELLDVAGVVNGANILQGVNGKLSLVIDDSTTVKHFGATGLGVVDDTAIINIAIKAFTAKGLGTKLGSGTFLIDPSVSLVMTTGVKMTGNGRRNTALLAKYNVAGNVIRRDFNLSSANEYVEDIHLADFAIFLNHKHQATLPSNIQIAFNMRNMTRTKIETCYAGNYRYGLAKKLHPNAANKRQAMRGYGYFYGNVSGSDPAYAGGEVHSNIDCKGWWLRKAFTLDDIELTGGNSAAYKTTITNPDIQTVENAIAQESRYNTGCVFEGCLIQDLNQAEGSTEIVNAYYIEGYDNRVSGGYIETNENDITSLIRLGTVSRNNVIEPFYHEITNAKFLDDKGEGNLVTFFEQPSKKKKSFYNNAPVDAFVKFHWDGSNIVIDGGDLAASITRTGVGDYTINFKHPYIDDDYGISIITKTNASGHGGMNSIASESPANLRFYTAAQNGAASSVIDPISVRVQITNGM